MCVCILGYLVLKDLGFKVEAYVASEIDEESITISVVNHSGKITHVNDVRGITQEHVCIWVFHTLLFLCTSLSRFGLFFFL